MDGEKPKVLRSNAVLAQKIFILHFSCGSPGLSSLFLFNGESAEVSFHAILNKCLLYSFGHVSQK